MGAPTPYARIPVSLLKDSRLARHQTAKLVYCVIENRVGNNGHCWPGMRSIAGDLGIDVKTAVAAVAILAKLGYLQVGHRKGKKGQNTYIVRSAPTMLALELFQRSDDSNKSAGIIGTGALESLEQNQPHTTNPSNQTHKRARPKRARPKWQPGDVQAIYEAYPRHVSKASAMKAIGRALDRIAGRPDAPANPLAWLLSCVQAFAKSPAGQAGRFTPYPATWFNGGRYDDDPSEWDRREDFKGEHDNERAAAAGSGQRADTPEAIFKHYDRFSGDRPAADRNLARIAAPVGKYCGLGETIGAVPRAGGVSGADVPARGPAVVG